MQSQERARKLREDLEIEEHRQLELSRILKEVLPVPKTSNVPKSRPGRKVCFLGILHKLFEAFYSTYV